MNRKPQSILSRVPVLRILVPFIAGIAVTTTGSSLVLPALLGAAGVILYAVMRWLIPHTPSWAMRVKSLWILPIAMASMALGMTTATTHYPPEIDLNDTRGSTASVIVDDIDFKDYSMTIHATLFSASKNNKQGIGCQHKILLTTRGCDYNLQPGDILYFTLDLKEIKSQGNPDSFDYAGYMLDQGIRYSQHLKLDEFMLAGHDTSLIPACNKLRRAIQLKIYNSNLGTKTQHFIVATLLGSSRFITPETRDSFSAAGIAHLLALSGLHVGILMGMAWFVLLPLDYMRMRRLRLILTILAMATYAVFTGLSPSVMRATIMMAIAMVGVIFYRKSVTLNAVATSAVLILALSPQALHSVGFQLSFITVSSIIIFASNRNATRDNKATWKRRLLNTTRDIALTSSIAMLSTIMLTAWYFSSISLTSAIANVCILPLFPVVMATSITILLLCCMGIEISWLNTVMDWMYGTIEDIARVCGDTIPGHVTGVYVTATEVIIYYIALTMFFMWYFRKRFLWLNLATAAIAALIIHHAWVIYKTPKSGMVMLADFKQTQIFTFNNGQGHLWVPDGDADLETFKRTNRKFLAHYRIDSITTTSNTTCDIVNNHTVTCAGKGKWDKTKPLTTPVKTDILVITKRYHDTISKLLKFYAPGIIILSGDIYEGNIEALENECNKLQIPSHSIKSQGAYIELGSYTTH